MENKIVFEWVVVAIVLIGLVYTMLVIKEEKKAYLENAINKQIGPLQFPFPSWWGFVSESEVGVVVERTDTRYEWSASYQWHSQTPDQSIEEQMRDYIQSQNILFDPDSTVIQTPQKFKEHPEVLSGNCEIVRIEGTATQNEIDRIYYDAFIIRDLKTGGHLIATSRSSVLNGLIEGPYFESTLEGFSRI